MSSILTNASSTVALQTLKSINKDLGKVQTSISTGKEISSAKDNAGLWAVARTMESDVAGFDAIKSSLGMGEATVGVAMAATEQIVNVLEDMKALAITANSENADFSKIEAGLAEMQAQIEGIRDAAQFNGANLLLDDVDGNGATQLTVLSSLDRVGTGNPSASTITVDTLDLTNNLDIANRTTIADITSAATALGEIEGYLQTAINGAAALGSAAARLSDQTEFVDKMSDAMRLGVSKLTDTNMEEASAKLQSLQVQQQLAVQSLQIANQAPNTLLQLFR